MNIKETLDLEKLSISARDFIESLSLDGFTLKQIKTLCKDRETELSKEVHSFLCKETKGPDNTEANNAAEKNESARKSFDDTLTGVEPEVLIEIVYALAFIEGISEAVDRLYTPQVGKDKIKNVCDTALLMFKSTDHQYDKVKFLRGMIAFMLSYQTIMRREG